MITEVILRIKFSDRLQWCCWTKRMSSSSNVHLSILTGTRWYQVSSVATAQRRDLTLTFIVFLRMLEYYDGNP